MSGSRFATGTRCRARCARTPRAIADPEGAALLDWFADGAMTLLGYHVEKPYEAPSEALGIFSIPALRPTKAAASAQCTISSKAATCR